MQFVRPLGRGGFVPDNTQGDTGMANTAKETGDVVWYLDAYQRIDNVFGFRSDLWEKDRKVFGQQYVRFNRGELSADEMPEQLWIMADSPSRKKKHLPHFVTAGDFFAVSARVAEVLSRFDLGSSVLKQVDLLKHDRATPFDGRWFLLQPERKEGFEPELSSNYKKPRYPDEDVHKGTLIIDGSTLPSAKTNQSVLLGSAIWNDPRLNVSLFVSDALMTALKDADVLGPLNTLRCPVVAT